MRVCDLRQKEVINAKDCRRLGCVGDVELDMEKGCVVAIIVPGPGCFCGFLGRDKEFVIPFCDIKKVGEDIILVDVVLKDVTVKCGI